MKKILSSILLLFLSISFLQAQTKKTAVTKIASVKNVRIKIITDSGIIIIKLNDSTPLHRDNFVKLVKQGFYDSLLFHRVVPNFVIQGGDPGSKNAPPKKMIGDGDTAMAKIPAEFRTDLFHKRGVLAAARESDDVNPTKASSACQFYIVIGQKFTDAQLDQMEITWNKVFTPEQRNTYKTIGGIPRLDGKYTIFGEVESGMNVVDKISMLPKDPYDRPLTDFRMKMEIMK